MTNDEMIECFNSAPKGSRHERMLWAACKIAGLTGATEGGAYKTLLVALIEAEGPDETAFETCEAYTSARAESLCRTMNLLQPWRFYQLGSPCANAIDARSRQSMMAARQPHCVISTRTEDF